MRTTKNIATSPPTEMAALGQWLRDEVVTGHAEYLANPSEGVPAEQILVRIKVRREASRGAD
ncbi:hypothetical protein [Asticcacaulis biprosthecium]|nr:hypothetical protein [Asticcacaulis biprosthecium]